jgi:3-methyladenine DNA glycosylase AlkD
MKATDAKRKLKSLASPARAKSSARFFKTGPGQYGEGDILIGVTAPVLRNLAREFRELPLEEVEILLQSPIHEECQLALLILVLVVAKADDAGRKTVYDFYLTNTKHVNNWDLVDSSAPALVGAYLIDKSRKSLVVLAKSKSRWERRIAIVATQHFIRHGEYQDTLKISRLLLADEEDLIHKAAGWMLREVGKKHQPTLESFLAEHGPDMPRTMLRYAIERFSPEKRRLFMAAKYDHVGLCLSEENACIPPARRSCFLHARS